jgi:hypothetical protein
MAHLGTCGGYVSSTVGDEDLFVGPGTPKVALFTGLSEVQATSTFIVHISKSN